MIARITQVIQILKVDAPEEKTSPKDGSKYTVRTAQTALFDDDGVLSKVGRLRIPESLVEVVKVGTFRAVLGLDVAAYGQQKGDIVPALIGLEPVVAGVSKTSPAASAAVPAAATAKTL